MKIKWVVAITVPVTVIGFLLLILSLNWRIVLNDCARSSTPNPQVLIFPESNLIDETELDIYPGGIKYEYESNASTDEIMNFYTDTGNLTCDSGNDQILCLGGDAEPFGDYSVSVPDASDLSESGTKYHIVLNWQTCGVKRIDR